MTNDFNNESEVCSFNNNKETISEICNQTDRSESLKKKKTVSLKKAFKKCKWVTFFMGYAGKGLRKLDGVG